MFGSVMGLNVDNISLNSIVAIVQLIPLNPVPKCIPAGEPEEPNRA